MYQKPLHQINEAPSDYLSILGAIETSRGSSWYPLPTSGTWFHDQVRTFCYEHQ